MFYCCLIFCHGLFLSTQVFPWLCPCLYRDLLYCLYTETQRLPRKERAVNSRIEAWAFWNPLCQSNGIFFFFFFSCFIYLVFFFFFWNEIKLFTDLISQLASIAYTNCVLVYMCKCVHVCLYLYLGKGLLVYFLTILMSFNLHYATLCLHMCGYLYVGEVFVCLLLGFCTGNQMLAQQWTPKSWLRFLSVLKALMESRKEGGKLLSASTSLYSEVGLFYFTLWSRNWSFLLLCCILILQFFCVYWMKMVFVKKNQFLTDPTPQPFKGKRKTTETCVQDLIICAY